ncbi:MAG: class I SAM-dependent methyltransferase, partial [Gammaproteobacteria bacterium]
MCLNCQITQFDQSRADAFADRLVGMLNEGALCVMLSIGHRTGLFDAMLGQAPMSSGEVAHRAGLNERYVREWLNGLVVGEIVEYDAASRTYWLPGEHANWLTRESEDGNIAVFMQYIPMMGTVEDELVTCFEQGGGVPYEKYDRFHEVMAEDSGQTVLSSLQQHILPLVPGLPGRLEQGIDVLDVGCGRGRAMNLLAKLYPTGIDLSAEAIEYATAEAARMGLDNVEFIARDVSELDSEAGAAQFDWITTFDAVHDQARPANVLKGICRALKDDGYYLMQDIHASSEVQNNMDHPIGPLL